MPPAHDVQLALSRIRSVLAPKHEAQQTSRDIRLGLERIVRVLPDVQEWQGIHVGGTNGKGSICAFLSGLFTLAGVSYGRYVSPAFPQRHNGISINGLTVNPRMYEAEASAVESQYQRVLRGWRFATSETPGPLSPFELETATAFRVFNKMRVKYGIVEVGMGGSGDATDAMRRKAVTIISKIDLDHQEYLGNTITEIAKVKAGIMRPGIPCIVDDSNSDEVIKVLRQHARSIGASLVPTWKAKPFLETLNNDRWRLEDYQKQNLLCAALAFRHVFPHKEINLDRLLETEPYLPGRMEWVEVDKLTNGSYRAPVLVDAAHNLLGVQALARHVDSSMRSTEQPITWVVGLSSSQTKPFAEMMDTLIRPEDNVAFVEYEQGANEPQPTPATIGREVVRNLVGTDEQVYNGEPNINDAFQWATSKAGNGHVIVTGSLYLVRDFYKLDGILRYRDNKTRQPGSAQLLRLTKLMQHRPLTKEEYEEFDSARSYWQRAKSNLASRKVTQNQETGLASNTVSAEEDSETSGSPTASEASVESNELTLLRQAENFHRGQVKAYRLAVRAVVEDVERDKEQDKGTVDLMRQDEERLKLRLDQHSKSLKTTLEKIRTLNRQTDNLPGQTGKPRGASDGFTDLNTLWRAAKHHKQQLQGYRSALRSIKDDVEEDSHHEGSSTAVEIQSLSRLQADIELLQQREDKHEDSLEKVMEQIRTHPDTPRVQGKILRHDPKLKAAAGAYSPFFNRTELDPKPEIKDEAQSEPEASPQRRKRNEPQEEDGETDFWGRRVDSETKV